MQTNSDIALPKKSLKVSSCFSDGSSESSDKESCSQDESWESSHPSSCSSCSESDSDDGSVEWENEVQGNGELYYIESDPSYATKISNEISENTVLTAPVSKNLTPKSWTGGGKLVRLIRRRESKRHRSNFTKTSHTDNESNGSKQYSSTQFQSAKLCNNSKAMTLFVAELRVDPWAKPNLGRRATLSETLLGLVTTCSESSVIVTDLLPDGPAAKQSSINIGDKICSINGKNVTNNINTLLETVHVPTTIYLELCPHIKLASDKQLNLDHALQKTYQTRLAERVSKQAANTSELETLLLQLHVGVLYLQLDGLTEGGSEDQGVLHCYPGTFKTNVLGAIRGTFLTLFQLLPDISNSTPKCSTVTVKHQLVHVVYIQEGRELLLIAVPSSWCSLPEAVKQSAELVRFLQFTHQSLSRCFSSHQLKQSLNHHLYIFLSRLLLGDKSAEAVDATTFQQLVARNIPKVPQFESVLPAAHLIPLPREAQIQIDDALSELESNDIGDVCEDLDCQRLYTILGSCFYHKGYLLASHLAHDDILDVHTFCRQQGLLQLLQSESVKSLIVWKEVYPSSVSRGLESSPNASPAYKTPVGRWFILIVGQIHAAKTNTVRKFERTFSVCKDQKFKLDLFMDLRDEEGCFSKSKKYSNPDGHPSPDIFYVEAAQDTLQHLKKTGISNIASEWIESQLRPKVTTPEAVTASRVSSRKVNNLLGLRVHDPGWQNSFSTIISTPSGRKSADSLVIGKRRPSPDHSSSGPLHTGETSEDSASLVASLPSDDTGFMAVKARMNRNVGTHSDNEASEESDSDWDASDTNTGHRLNSTTDMSDLCTSLLKDVEGTVPSKLTAGLNNIAFHYVHIDTREGVLLSPIHFSLSASFSDILSKFRLSAMHIHLLFQNTISFKKLKGSEASQSLINKSLVAIKEFGVLFECHLPKGSDKASVPMTYWVVGRLFFMPTPREVYVCYEDSAPQNLIELAFRLALTTVG